MSGPRERKTELAWGHLAKRGPDELFPFHEEHQPPALRASSGGRSDPVLPGQGLAQWMRWGETRLLPQLQSLIQGNQLRLS